PQDAVDNFWQGFNARKPGHVRRILRLGKSSTGQDPARLEGKTISNNNNGSYEAAREACIRRVQAIVRECKRHNRKFQDEDFDIHDDFRYTLCKDSDFLHGLPTPQSKSTDLAPLPPPPPPGLPFEQKRPSEQWPDDGPYRKGRVASTDTTKHPRAVHRVSEIFERPLLTPRAPKTYLAHPPGPSSRFLSYVRSHLKRLGVLLETRTGIIARFHAARERLPTVKLPPWTFLVNTIIGKMWSILCFRWEILLAVYLWTTTAMLVLARFSNLLSIRLTLQCLFVNACLAAVLRVSTTIKSRASCLHFNSGEIRQSDNLGNCWWLSAIATLSSRDQLLRKLFVAWDQDCGVYGFCFYRDGSWIYTVIDDYLYLTSPDFLGSGDNPPDDRSGRRYNAWKSGFQRGSDALFFGKCQDPNQTWLPLLEKAYSKIHGDYDAVHGGCPSEAVEDLTGGVSSPLPPSSVLEKDRLWKEMLGAGKDHVYSLNAPATGASSKMRGITLMHAFSVDRAFWYFDFHQFKWIRLLEIRNPWGCRDGVWEGAWGPCSKEWSLLSTWFLRRNPQQDGVFFMTYEDAMTTFDSVERTRLLDEQDWFIKQSWVKMDVAWAQQYNPVYFTVHLTKPSEVVFALSQLEDRYWLGLVGRYVYHLTILVRKRGDQDGEYIACESAGDEVQSCARRSVTVEKHLEAGEYEVLVRINALTRGTDNIWSVEDVIRQSMNRPKKLQQMARNYDEAFCKLRVVHPSGRWDHSPQSCASSDTDSDSGSDVFDPVKSTTKMISKPEDAAWNAVCGVGLRVFSKDPELHIELCHRQSYLKDWFTCTSGSRSGVLTPSTDTASEADSEDEWHDFEGPVTSCLGANGDVVEIIDTKHEDAIASKAHKLGEDNDDDDDDDTALRKLGWIGA
ncbi:Calpain-9, partial [Pseudocercospora fuligena]